MKEIAEMTDDELRAFLKEIRDNRKRVAGVSKVKSKARSQTDSMFENLDSAILIKILQELKGREKEQNNAN